MRKINANDLNIRVSWLNDPRIYSYMHFKFPVSLNETKLWLERVESTKNRLDFVFEIEEKVVAMGGVTHFDEKVGKSELYVFVDPNMNGQGVGTKAVTMICDYGFSIIGLNKIYLFVDENNIVARKIYEKNNFLLEGILRNESIRNGTIINRCYYGILKEDFELQKQKNIC